jgi:hypothetical protein
MGVWFLVLETVHERALVQLHLRPFIGLSHGICLGVLDATSELLPISCLSKRSQRLLDDDDHWLAGGGRECFGIFTGASTDSRHRALRASGHHE